MKRCRRPREEEQVFWMILQVFKARERSIEEAEALTRNHETKTMRKQLLQAEAAKTSSTQHLFVLFAHQLSLALCSKSKGKPIIRTFIIVCLPVFFLNMNPREFQKALEDESWVDANDKRIVAVEN
ncbi:hypothetical protein Tco_0327258 [Tanacetum coccineum]